MFDNEGFHVSTGKNNFALIRWNNIEEQGHYLCEIGGRLHINLKLKDTEDYLNQLNKINKVGSVMFYKNILDSTTVFPIEGFDLAPEEFLEKISQGITHSHSALH